jgi:ankyrin repeat protein
MLAAKNGHTKTVVRLLHVPGINVNAQSTESTNTPQGITALMIAAGAGHSEILERLLQAPGIDVNVQDGDGNTAFMHAIDNGHDDTAQMLLQVSGIDVNAALIHTACVGKTAIVRMILDSDKIQVGLKNNLPQIKRAYDGAYNLSYGHAGRRECMALLSDAISKINSLDRDLRHAARDGKTEDVARLLAAGADVNARSPLGCDRALQLAVCYGHTEVVRQLLAVPGIHVDPIAWTYAFVNGHTEILRLIFAMPDIGIVIDAKTRELLLQQEESYWQLKRWKRENGIL